MPPRTLFRSRLSDWSRRHPALLATLLLWAIYCFYAYTNNYKEFYWDSYTYWKIAQDYWSQGKFNFLLFNHSLRGYLFPLLISPLVLMTERYAVLPIDLYRAIGAGMAAVTFGAVVPGLWQAVQWNAPQAPVTLARRLLLGALGFIFWRGYFHFPLTDFPALLMLGGGVWALLRGRSVGAGLLAGVLVAAGANFRPVYAAALPLAGLLCLWPRPATPSEAPQLAVEWLHRLAFVAGLALVMWPQSVLNRVHFGVNSPFVLTTPPNVPSLYLLQLQWGLQYKKYETNVGSDYASPQMYFVDPRGQELWERAGISEFKSYDQYGQLFLANPLNIVRIWASHLFNGLDIQYPTPYIQQVYVPSWGMAWLNYTLIFSSLWVLVVRRSSWFIKTNLRLAVVLLALLGPCAATLPVAMECRFLLPVHLLLYAVFAFTIKPVHAWRTSSVRQRAWTGLLYAGFVSAFFSLSINTQSRLALGPREVFTWKQNHDGEPW